MGSAYFELFIMMVLLKRAFVDPFDIDSFPQLDDNLVTELAEVLLGELGLNMVMVILIALICHIVNFLQEVHNCFFSNVNCVCLRSDTL